MVCEKKICLIIYCWFWLGRIEFDEFAEVVADSYFKKFSRAEILEAFRRFDQNRDGYIEADELKCVLTKLGRNFSNEEVNQPFSYYMHEWIIEYLFRFVVW
jgi:Ca2+-binding EF-hand superfamily protein